MELEASQLTSGLRCLGETVNAPQDCINGYMSLKAPIPVDCQEVGGEIHSYDQSRSKR